MLEIDPVTVLNALQIVFEDICVAKILESRIEGAPSFGNFIESLLFERETGTFLYYLIANFILKTTAFNYVNLKKSIYMDIARYLMRNHVFSVSTPIYGGTIDDYINNFSSRIEVNLYFSELSVEEKGSLLLTMLKKSGQISEPEMAILYKIAELSPYTEVLVYLLEQKKEYSKCVNYFIKCQSFSVKKKVFAWLDEVFAKISEKDRELLKSDVMESLSAFVEIDSDLTAKIVTNWYAGRHIEVVRKLDNAPKLQMKYLGELTKEALEEDLVFRYVVLLCQNDPKAVLPFLSGREDYNIDESLEECLKNNVVEAAAFLHEKLGNIQDALQLLRDRAEANKRILSSAIESLQPIPKDIVEMIYSDIKKCIDLCLRNSKRLDAAESEEH